ncbi:TIGR03086 family metal-binding protein [Micropruina sonneratiae]|uniref:TIGR03086 family metal-binding protein n=1 Tax=Micropruina sonneratiae TaxID=2986940 RepID=UPI002227B3AC|nr:TIGR03086 family metal-binding protein [Micropruina sp. KQZ13P-5]MCW3159287.1 TIGR03086 family metal-binding protein [Micropruina sp. KQZ13P-5]
MSAEFARHHRERAATFSRVVEQVTDWDAPTPVAEWKARDVVGHLTTWFPAFLAAGGVAVPSGDPGDPAGSWVAQSAAVQALLDDPDRAAAPFTHPQVGTHRLGGAIDTFYTPDVFMHTWDLARSAGLEVRLDEATCAGLLAGMEAMGPMLRESGQFGVQRPVAADALAQDRLVAFIGRDPHWRP